MSQIMQERVLFMVMVSSMTSQGDLKVALYIPLWMKNYIFYDNWIKNRDVNIKLGVHMYQGIVNMPL